MRRRPWAYTREQKRYFDGLLGAGVVAVPCSVCGKLVDLTLTGRGRGSRSIDHHVAWSKGGSLLDLANWRVCHYGCNSTKRDKVLHVRLDVDRSSREW